ncbi:MAG: PAS domain S-box protein, partial [Candidatus Hydrogenedentales bacterium]
MPKNVLHAGPSLRIWILLYLLTALMLSAGGYFYYLQEVDEIRAEKSGALSAIGELKVKQIVQWRKERLGDARDTAESPFFRRALEDWIREPDAPGVREEWKSRLVLEQDAYGYADALLLSPDGRVLLSALDKSEPAEPVMMQACQESLAKGKALISDFYRGTGGIVYLDVVAPAFGTDGQLLTFVVLRCKADDYLYPLIQTWPTPSSSSETLLVKREGEEAVFLNELRHRANTALTLRKPMSNTELPAAQAIKGRVGAFEGTDYRGKKVLADLRPVPDSPWFVVSKMDMSEILSDARGRAQTIAVYVTLLMLLVAAIIASLYRRRQAGLYRGLYRIEREQREVEEKFRTILYSIGDAVITTDKDGKVAQMNPVAEQLTGWKEADAKGMPLEEVFRIVSEETRAVPENPAQRALREGKVVGLANHTLLIARDGTERPISDSGAPIRDESGVITGVVLIFRDQTKERAAEEHLRQSEERLRLAMSAAEQGMFDLNVQTGRAIVNSEYAHNLGYSLAEFEEANLKWNRRVHPDDLDGVYTAYREYAAGNRPEYRAEFRQKTRSGEWKWALSVGKIVERDNEGRPLRMLGTHTDITERKEAELALQGEQLFSQALLDSLPGIFYLYTYPDLRLIAWNKNHESYLGYGSEEIENRHILEWHPAQAHEAVRQAVDEVMKEGQNSIEASLLDKDGNMVPFFMTGVRFESQGQLYLMGMGIDISERKRSEAEKANLESQLRQAQKMEAVGQLAGGVAHDFNNMLSVILGHSELALAALDASNPVCDDIQEIMKAGRRSADLTRQLLAFARKQTIAPQVLDLNDAIANMLKMLGRLIGEDIDLLWKPGRCALSVKMDPAQLNQILANLVVNARDAIKDIGKVTIETGMAEFDGDYCENHVGFTPGKYVLLAVSDDGCGMDKETMQRLFEPFFTTKEVGKGT